MEPDQIDMMSEKEIKNEFRALVNENIRLRAAMQKFVDRVEAGEVRSTQTYEQFKAILA